MAGSEYFFELLTEEIPAWMLDAQLLVLRRQCSELAQNVGGRADQVTVGATPRRLFFVLADLPDRTPDHEEEIKGPPRKVAYDANGNATAALQGFLKKNNATPSDLLSTEGDDYIRLRRNVPGRAVAELISESVPGIVQGLRWPKMMRWGQGDHAFIRPVHSIVSIFGKREVGLEMFGIKSGRSTVGHRVLSPQKIEVDSFRDYATRLRSADVIVDAEERVVMMKDQSRQLSAAISGVPAEDAAIWDQWKYLTEWPGIIRAQFDPQFLALPREVLTTVMRVHQKQLPILSGGNLTSSFLAIVDQKSDLQGNAVSGNSFVTNARFADARFFYETDRKRPLETRLEDLRHLQFQEKLSDYFQKTNRIVALAGSIHAASGSRIDGGLVAQAARLSKADLGTEMVKEFTELQGKIGGIYAREEGLPEEVWTAIYDHYLPVNLDDALPRGEAGAIVSLADRIDTLCGFFSIDLKPSGSKDPFALRRAAQGAVQILLNQKRWHINVALEPILDAALESFPNSKPETRREVLDFLAERVRTLLESPPYELAYDEIAAAMESGWSNSLPDLVARASALRAIRGAADFLSILDSAKRIENITAGASTGGVNPALFQHPSEKRLFDLIGPVGEHIDELIARRQYQAALESFAGMASELETFFIDVMVNVEDETVRENRMALLKLVGNAARKIADVTKIVIDRRDYSKRG